MKNRIKLSFGENSGYMQLNQDDELAKLYFYGDICGSLWDKWTDDDKCPTDVVDFIEQIENGKELELHINSGGGDAFAGIAIYNLLKNHNGEKTAYVDGLAASAASMIPLACDKVIMPESAQLMIHSPWTYIVGNASDLRKVAENLDLCQSSIIDIYMSKAKDGIGRDTIENLVNEETWLKAQDAAKYFDIEVQKHGNISACISNCFNQYRRVPNSFVNQNDENNDAELEKMRIELELLTF